MPMRQKNKKIITGPHLHTSTLRIVGCIAKILTVSRKVLKVFRLQGTVSEQSDNEKNAKIWKQTTAMSDVSKSTDF